MKIFTDGGARGNPGERGIGVVVYDEEGKVVWEKGKAIGVGTNNEAEYEAVVLALKWLKENEVKEKVDFYLDSKLVVEQLNKRWKIKESRLGCLASQCWEMIVEGELKVKFNHVRRSQNVRADELVNAALDRKML
ncbi:ribonuclease HI family protein [Microgenomates group bacterium]|nr:ribonuclease HI family protein [Microgenomates group bacterium]